jgi:hypothetical protein
MYFLRCAFVRMFSFSIFLTSAILAFEAPNAYALISSDIVLSPPHQDSGTCKSTQTPPAPPVVAPLIFVNFTVTGDRDEGAGQDYFAAVMYDANNTFLSSIQSSVTVGQSRTDRTSFSIGVNVNLSTLRRPFTVRIYEDQALPATSPPLKSLTFDPVADAGIQSCSVIPLASNIAPTVTSISPPERSDIWRDEGYDYRHQLHWRHIGNVRWSARDFGKRC